MSQLEPIHYGLIAAVVIAIIFIILFFVSLKQRKNSLAKVQEQHKKQNESLKSEHKEKLDHERVENKKVLSKQKEEHQVEISQKEREIDSLKIFSKNEGEYITDRHLLDLRDQLVNERRIRPEDMHIMANIFLPKDPLGKVHQIDHIVLTRTGIYVIDSNLVNGHIYHGITEQQFSEFPILGQVFETLDLNPKKEQTLLLEKQASKKSAAFHDYTDKVKEVDETSEELQRQLELKYTPTPIIYFHPDEVDEATSSNYSQDPNIKVLVGEQQLQHFFNKFVFHGRFQYSVEDLERIMDELEKFNP
ncbi:NERD domain-containing protein [Staphylococcus lentus]|uniref:nuclease-related domain-containing protein n=1 Tax=Mammaliicoccus lentus TaxID=42858 RepID=UPI0018831B22|nr:nuclease-related domain-containing protein [Mammaliicoccus lentus]MBF0842607.1 NERD domain-containing protein [Mammaliicoccus lentus]